MTHHLLRPLHPDQERMARALAVDAAAPGLQAHGIHNPADCNKSGAVTEGPAVPYGYPEDETVAVADFPYAMKLDRWLLSNGVRARFRAIEGGSWIGGVQGTIQLITCKDLPEDMGRAIVTRCGREVEFVEMRVPQSPHLYASVQKVGGVWVRHIIDYEIGSDDYRQRWDVLVRSI